MFDQSLLRLIKKKPNRGMSALMDRYTGLVYSAVKNRISGICTEEDIEEIVSDVFVAFYNQVDKIDTEKGSLASYLITIAKKKLLTSTVRAANRQNCILTVTTVSSRFPTVLILRMSRKKTGFTPV